MVKNTQYGPNGQNWSKWSKTVLKNPRQTKSKLVIQKKKKIKNG